MKNILLSVLGDYLKKFPEESERQTKLIEHLNKYDDIGVIDWDNFDGHVVAGGFIYAKKEKKFLVLYHKDLKMYVYPGGHIDVDDINSLEAAKREIFEETGLYNLEQFKLLKDSIIPIDIDTHIISYNERLNLPSHYHYDFRYLFMVDKVQDVQIDTNELANYKWVDVGELNDAACYGKILGKIQKLVTEYTRN